MSTELEIDMNNFDVVEMLNEIEKLHCDDDEEFHITERGTYWKYGSFTKKASRKA